MPIADYSNSSALLRGNAARRVVDPSSRPTDFMQLCMEAGSFVPVNDTRIGGPEPVVLAIVTGNGSTAHRFVEGQALPGGGRRSFASATLNAFYWREVVKVTGRMADINRARGFVEDDFVAQEIANATANVLYLAESDLLGSTDNLGLSSVNDDTTSYGGVNPGTYTVWANKTSTSVGNQTAATLADHYEASSAAPYNSRPTHILMPPNQVGNYTAIMGPVASSTPTRLVLPGDGPVRAYDIGIRPEVTGYNGIPVRQINNLTTTETHWLDMNQYLLAVQRDASYKALPDQADDAVGQVSMALIVVNLNRRAHSKQEGVTA